MSKPTGTLSSDHAASAETLSAILKKEITFARYSCKGYLNPSDPTIITATDRKELVDWCYGVLDQYQLPRETVATAMEMVDRFLSISAGPFALWDVNSDVAKVGRNALHSQSMFQLLTVAALSHSTLKLKDEMTSDEFAEACGIYTTKEIEAMEYTLLRGLSWRSNTPASQVGHAILSLLIRYVNLPTWGFLLDEMNYQTKVAVRDYYFSTQRPSTIAMAAISNAIESISKAHEEMLKTCLSGILECFDYDHPVHINAARRRLQRHIRQESTVEEGDTPSTGTIQDSTKTSKLKSLDDFMRTFPTSEDKKMHSVPASTAATVSPGKDMMKPIKPMRPLPAYYIYLQIEKEFIIQSIPGKDADKSIHDDKVYLDNVPERYRQTKLSPDWYKRKKRKHRKQHGKIGFKELTSMVASRWADLEKTNPDIKRFVQNIAERELMEYHREMKEYVEQMKAITIHNAPVFSKSKKFRKRVLYGDTESQDNAPNKLLKQPWLSPRCSSPLNVHSIAETVGETEFPVKTTTRCQSKAFSNDLTTFTYRYRHATKHNITSTNIADRKAGGGEKVLRRLVSSKDDYQE